MELQLPKWLNGRGKCLSHDVKCCTNPVGVKYDDGICSSEVDAESSCARTHDEDEHVGIRVELCDLKYSEEEKTGDFNVPLFWRQNAEVLLVCVCVPRDYE